MSQTEKDARLERDESQTETGSASTFELPAAGRRLAVDVLAAYWYRSVSGQAST